MEKSASPFEWRIFYQWQQSGRFCTAGDERGDWLEPQVKDLLSQLSGREVTYYHRLHDDIYLLCAFHRTGLNGRNHQLVGMGLLLPIITFTHHAGQIHNVVVDKKFRGRGIGKGIVSEMLKSAKERFHMKYVDLTSRPARVEANRLYQSIGFLDRGTNCYRYTL